MKRATPCAHAVEQDLWSYGHVVAVVLGRVRHRFADLDEAGGWHHRRRAPRPARHRRSRHHRCRRRAGARRRPRRDGRWIVVVGDRHAVAGAAQLLDHVRTDAGTADDEGWIGHCGAFGGMRRLSPMPGANALPYPSRDDDAPDESRLRTPRPARRCCWHAWAAAALVSIFLHGPVPLYSTPAWRWPGRCGMPGWLVPLFNGAVFASDPAAAVADPAGWLVTGVGDAAAAADGAAVDGRGGADRRWRAVSAQAGFSALAAWAMAGFWYFFMFAAGDVRIAADGGGARRPVGLVPARGRGVAPVLAGFALAVGFDLLVKGRRPCCTLGVPLLAARWWHPAARERGFHKGVRGQGGVGGALAGSSCSRCGWCRR